MTDTKHTVAIEINVNASKLKKAYKKACGAVDSYLAEAKDCITVDVEKK